MALKLKLLCLVVLFSSGCQFIGLQGDLDRLDAAARLPVHVIGVPGETSPQVVAILTPNAVGLTVLNYAVLPKSGRVTLPVASGQHYLVAFHDRNGNLRFDAGEPGARFGEPTRLDLKPGTTHQEITLRLSPNGGRADRWPDDFKKRAEHLTLQPYLPVVGEIVTLADGRFDQQVVEQGLWSPAGFLMEGGRLGIYFLQAYDAQKPVVLLVHGINGSPRELAPLIEVVQRAGYQPWLYYYPSGLRLRDLSTALMRSLLTLRALHRPTNISVLAYSMGGLVAWDALDQLNRNGEAGFIDRVLTISSPFGGIESAEIGVQYAPTVVPSWLDLAPTSPFLKRLSAIRMPGTVPHQMLVSLPARAGNQVDDGVVSIDSQRRVEIIEGASYVAQIDASHSAMLTHPETRRSVRNWLLAVE